MATETLPLFADDNDRMTAPDVCRILDIKRSTLRTWIEIGELDVPRDRSGAMRFTPELLTALKRIQTLRTLDNRSGETIRRKLSVEMPTLPRAVAGAADGTAAAPHVETGGTATAAPDPEKAHDNAPATPTSELADVVTALRELVAQQGQAPQIDDLAEELGDRLGFQLVTALQQQNDLARQYGDVMAQLAAAQTEARMLRQQNAELEAKVTQLSLPAPAPKTLWQKLFG